VHHDLLSPYRHGASAIHRLPPALKVPAALAFVVGVVLLPRGAWAIYAACALGLLLLAVLSHLRPSDLAKRLLLVEPFALGVALLALCQPHGATIFASMLAKSTLGLFCMVLLSCTTRMTAIIGLLRRLHVPALLVTTLALTYRYLFLLLDESDRLRRARRSRAFSAQRHHVWRAMAGTIAQLFVRTSERAERVYAAMCARGWQ